MTEQITVPFSELDHADKLRTVRNCYNWHSSCKCSACERKFPDKFLFCKEHNKV